MLKGRLTEKIQEEHGICYKINPELNEGELSSVSDYLVELIKKFAFRDVIKKEYVGRHEVNVLGEDDHSLSYWFVIRPYQIWLSGGGKNPKEEFNKAIKLLDSLME